jgi:hypothetical protein
MTTYVRPLATAFAALVLIVLAVFWPPEPVGVARSMPDPHYQQLLPRSSMNDDPVRAAQGWDSDDIITGAYLTGLTMIFLGCMALVWHRSLPRGRHRTVQRLLPRQQVGSPA